MLSDGTSARVLNLILLRAAHPTNDRSRGHPDRRSAGWKRRVRPRDTAPTTQPTPASTAGASSDGATNRTPLTNAHASPSGDDDQRTQCLRNTAPTSGPDQGCGHLNLRVRNPTSHLLSMQPKAVVARSSITRPRSATSSAPNWRKASSETAGATRCGWRLRSRIRPSHDPTGRRGSS